MILEEVEDLNDSLFANICNKFVLWAALNDLYSAFINFWEYAIINQFVSSLSRNFTSSVYCSEHFLSISCNFLVCQSMSFEEVHNRRVVTLESLK